MNDLIKELTRVLGQQGVLTGEDVSNRAIGWGSSIGMAAKAIIRPASTEEVSKALKICHQAGQSVVTQGGLTGLAGGAVTTAKDIALSMERMNQVEEIDTANRSMVAQAGVPLQNAQDQAAQAGLKLAVDLGARGSCTLGGNIATNAGGNQVIRYGMMRDNVLGLEAVLADGTVISSMNKMLKNNAGYDLKQLFIGSEGTLGVITRAVIRLRQQPLSQNTALVAVEDFDRLTQLLKSMDSELGGTLNAFEVMWHSFYDLIINNGKHQAPLPENYPYYVLIEACGANQADDTARFIEILGQLLEEGIISDASIAQSQSQCDALWAIRDDIEGLYDLAPIFLFDVSMPISAMQDFVINSEIQLKKNWPDSRCIVFGHMGDGNLHVIVAVGSDTKADKHKVEDIIYGCLPVDAGCIAAEHGIGLEKLPYLHLTRTNQEIQLMRLLKNALDPKDILNPGKVIPEL